ncbi:hypothetical protein [Alkalibacillus aidingensis]|nr:hypothetical protein [Alkalibacillus aidingensis]
MGKERRPANELEKKRQLNFWDWLFLVGDILLYLPRLIYTLIRSMF